MTKSERLLFIVNLFRVRKRISLEELEKECEVSSRTIYRDLLALSALNIPIYFDNGYRLAGDISLPPLNFTQDEQELLGFSLKNSCLTRSAHLSNKLRHIEMKILSVMPNRKSNTLNSMLKNIKADNDRFTPNEDHIMGEFIKRLFHEEKLNMVLKNGGKTIIGLKAHSLQIKGKRWILCFTKGDQSKLISISLNKILCLYSGNNP